MCARRMKSQACAVIKKSRRECQAALAVLRPPLPRPLSLKLPPRALSALTVDSDITTPLVKLPEILTMSGHLCVRLLWCFASAARKTPLQSNCLLVPDLNDYRVRNKVDMHTIWSLAMISLVETQHMMASSTSRRDQLKRTCNLQPSDARSMLQVHCCRRLRRESTHLLQHVPPMALLYGDLLDSFVSL